MPAMPNSDPKVQRASLTSRAGSWKLAGAGLLVVFAGWLLVILTIVHGPGIYEARFLANQTAAVLALLVGTLLAGKPPAGSASDFNKISSTFVALLPLPFLAIILLPYGLRSLAGAALVLPLAAAGALLWQRWQRAGREPDMVVDGATVAATLALAFVLEPVQLVAGRALSNHSAAGQLELLGCAVALGIGACVLRRQWGVGGFLAALTVVILGGLSWFGAVALFTMAAMQSLVMPSVVMQSHVNAPLAGRRRRLILTGILVLIACAFSWVGLLLPMAAWARGPRRGWFAVLVVLGATLAMALPSQSWTEVSGGLIVLLLLFPFAFFPSVLSSSSGTALPRSETVGLRALQFSSSGAWRLLTGLAMTAVALRTLEVHLALMPAALLWCAPVPPLGPNLDQKSAQDPGQNTPRDHGTVATWLALWLAALALAASYPWLRPTPLLQQIDTAQQLAGATNRQHLLTLGLCAALALVLWLARSLLGPEKRRTLTAPLMVTALLPAVLLGLWGIVPTSVHTIHRWPPTVLTEAAPLASFPVDTFFEGQEGPPGDDSYEVWIDSFLANAAALEGGTNVAHIAFTGIAFTGNALAGKDLARRTPTERTQQFAVADLVSGIDTAEWRAPDNATRTTSTYKPDDTSAAATHLTPFSYWWTDDEPPNLGQRFRARLPLQPAALGDLAASEGLLVERNPRLPSTVQLRIDRVALSRTRGQER